LTFPSIRREWAYKKVGLKSKFERKFKHFISIGNQYFTYTSIGMLFVSGFTGLFFGFVVPSFKIEGFIYIYTTVMFTLSFLLLFLLVLFLFLEVLIPETLRKTIFCVVVVFLIFFLGFFFLFLSLKYKQIGQFYFDGEGRNMVFLNFIFRSLVIPSFIYFLNVGEVLVENLISSNDMLMETQEMAGLSLNYIDYPNFVNLFEDTSYVFLRLGQIYISWEFLFDPINFVLVLVVLSITFFVKIYSVEYMASEYNKFRFFVFLYIFSMFMILLLCSSNFFQLFVGWEGVGLSSFLLINFWSTRKEANYAAIKAILINRIGDIALLIAILYLAFYTGTFDIIVCLTMSELIFTDSERFAIGILLLIAAMAKSAQYGLHTWLPDAMEGPTPVSALLHAATMVTAGVFLLIRFALFFKFYSDLYWVCFFMIIQFFAVCTIIYSGIMALYQNDIKKIIAYSTCGQIGYMFYACGTENYGIALFHLSTHAYFKALLFLAAGALIHSYRDEQDIRVYSLYIKSVRLIFVSFLVGILCLIGFGIPRHISNFEGDIGFGSFFSKELILEWGGQLSYGILQTDMPNVNFKLPSIFILPCHVNLVAVLWGFVYLSVILTILYSFKILFMTFRARILNLLTFGNRKKVSSFQYKRKLVILRKKIHKPGLLMSFSLVSLSIISVFFGYFANGFFIDSRNKFFESGNSGLMFVSERILYNDLYKNKGFLTLKDLHVHNKMIDYGYLQGQDYIKLPQEVLNFFKEYGIKGVSHGILHLGETLFIFNFLVLFLFLIYYKFYRNRSFYKELKKLLLRSVENIRVLEGKKFSKFLWRNKNSDNDLFQLLKETFGISQKLNIFIERGLFEVLGSTGIFCFFREIVNKLIKFHNGDNLFILFVVYIKTIFLVGLLFIVFVFELKVELLFFLTLWVIYLFRRRKR
jgi:NADH:ubiquinone oxidoreductase subunit 5 (subunit L)/multisubunit Na+/H+ antiporter MnhA subunit